MMPKFLRLAAAIFFATNFAAPTSAAALEWSSLDKAVAAWSAPDSKPSKYMFAMCDLNGDSISDVVVLVTDPNYCGTGGCSLLIFEGTKHGFAFTSESTISNEPIYVLPKTEHGWHTLVVTASGGGMPLKHALMKFDGKQYPLNPSLEPPTNPADLNSTKPLKFVSSEVKSN